jgi:hypothetical protein
MSARCAGDIRATTDAKLLSRHDKSKSCIFHLTHVTRIFQKSVFTENTHGPPYRRRRDRSLGAAAPRECVNCKTRSMLQA